MRKTTGNKGRKRSSHPRPELHPQTFYLECKSEPKEIRKIEPFLHKVNGVARLDDGTFYRLLVASTEAVNNAILHGNKSDLRKRVFITCIVGTDALIFRVRDEGKGFKPENVPNPLDEKNLLNTSGRGVFLMRSLTDHVKYDITPDGTEVELTIDLTLLK